MILREAIAGDLIPSKKGGLTFYPAAALDRIFQWAQGSSRQVKWVEGVFYSPETDEGQLSLGYICECGDTEYAAFRDACLSLVPEIGAEAATKSMAAYFEIGISD